MVHVKDLVKRNVGRPIPIITPDATVFEAIKKLDKLNAGALLVIENKVLKGIFSERDYTRKVFLKGKQSTSTSVRQIMTKNVIFIQLDNTLEECMIVMNGRGIRHLPVLHGEEILDLISITDVVKSIVDNKDFLINQLTQYITGHQTAQKKSWQTPASRNVIPIHAKILHRKMGSD